MTQLVWAGVAITLTLPDSIGIVGAVTLAAMASWWLTVPASAVSAAIAFLVVDGFIQGSGGDLVWDGAGDAWLLLALLCASAVVSDIRGAALQSADRH